MTFYLNQAHGLATARRYFGTITVGRFNQCLIVAHMKRKGEITEEQGRELLGY